MNGNSNIQLPPPQLFFNLFKLHKISFCTRKCKRSQPLHFGYCFYCNNKVSWKYLWGKSNDSVVVKCVYLCVSVCVMGWISVRNSSECGLPTTQERIPWGAIKYSFFGPTFQAKFLEALFWNTGYQAEWVFGQEVINTKWIESKKGKGH